MSNVSDDLNNTDVDIDILRKHATELKDAAKVFRQKGRVLAARYAEIGAAAEGRSLRCESFRLDTHAIDTLKVINSTLKSVGAKSLTLNESINSWLNKSNLEVVPENELGNMADPSNSNTNDNVGTDDSNNSVISSNSNGCQKSIPCLNTPEGLPADSFTKDSSCTTKENIHFSAESNACNLNDNAIYSVSKASASDANYNTLITQNHYGHHVSFFLCLKQIAPKWLILF